MSGPTLPVSSYLEYLPAIFRQGYDEGGVHFLGRFLLAFEKVLTGLGDPADPGLEETLDGIRVGDRQVLGGLQRLFEPGPGLEEGQRAPADFLGWLAGWVALSLRADWSEEEQRRFISQIVPLYRQRGTARGLKAMLQAYTGLTADDAVRIAEFEHLPDYFQVELSLGLKTIDPEILRRKEQIARAIIEREKPAHTFYALKIVDVPTWQLGHRTATGESHSTLGVSTMLGTPQRTNGA